MGFHISNFLPRKGYSKRSTDKDMNGVFTFSKSEPMILDIDLQFTNSLDGDFSIQGISTADMIIQFYYSNWIVPFDHTLPFTGLDPDNIQSDSLDKCLWFKHSKSHEFPTNTPKHYQVVFPICRYIKAIATTESVDKVTAAIHILTV